MSFQWAVAMTMHTIMAEQKVFKEMCASLPKEEADKLRLERREKFKREEDHRKALEIAHAGRARNFWGK